MNKQSSYDLNRSVHLGRRDAFMEKAAEISRKCLRESSDQRRMQQVDASLYYLQEALEHSVLAAKSARALPDEESLIVFVRYVILYLHSTVAAMQIEAQLKDKASGIWHFLHKRGKPGSAQGVTRGGRKLLEDVAQFFKTIESSYSALRKNISASMDDAEKSRYDNAYRGIKTHVSTRRHQRHALRHGRISGPALLAKYESW